MKKIRLDLDALDVESFATRDTPEAERGTVHGQGVANPWFTLDGHDSCYGMCATHEYNDCGACTVGPSCEYYCLAQSVGCSSGPETELC